MADQDFNERIGESDQAAPRRERSFAPLPQEAIQAGTAAAKAPEKAKRRVSPQGAVPPARVDPEMVRLLQTEIDHKVTSGRSRMRWFANHLILFVAAVVGAVPLKLTLFAELHEAFIFVPFATWVGLLAFHANYAMNPILRRSKTEVLLKPLVPAKAKDEDQQEFDWDKK